MRSSSGSPAAPKRPRWCASAPAQPGIAGMTNPANGPGSSSSSTQTSLSARWRTPASMPPTGGSKSPPGVDRRTPSGPKSGEGEEARGQAPRSATVRSAGDRPSRFGHLGDGESGGGDVGQPGGDGPVGPADVASRRRKQPSRAEPAHETPAGWSLRVSNDGRHGAALVGRVAALGEVDEHEDVVERIGHDRDAAHGDVEGRRENATSCAFHALSRLVSGVHQPVRLVADGPFAIDDPMDRSPSMIRWPRPSAG